MPRRYDLLVFDWDGTLFDSTASIVLAIQRACADLGEPVPSDEQAAYVIGLGLRDALLAAVPTLKPERYGQMSERYRHHYLRAQQQLTLFAGIEPLLHAARQRGHLLAVATGKSRRGLDDVLHHTALRGVFDASRTADETLSKPDPLMLNELLAELDVAPERALMIGDTTHDLGMAQAAGVDSLAVTYGAHRAHQFDGFAPRAVVDSVAGLAAWLEAYA